MRSNVGDIVDMLVQQAKTNPTLKSYIDAIDQHTPDTINALRIMPWQRAALAKLWYMRDVMRKKFVEGEKQFDHTKPWRYAVPEAIEACIIDGVVPAIPGEIREWRGGEAMLPLDRGNFISISDGKLLWFPTTGGMWTENVFAKSIPEITRTSSWPIGYGSRVDYSRMVRDRLNNQPTAGLPVIDLTGGGGNPEARSTTGGFKFTINRM